MQSYISLQEPYKSREGDITLPIWHTAFYCQITCHTTWYYTVLLTMLNLKIAYYIMLYYFMLYYIILYYIILYYIILYYIILYYIILYYIILYYIILYYIILYYIILYYIILYYIILYYIILYYILFLKILEQALIAEQLGFRTFPAWSTFLIRPSSPCINYACKTLIINNRKCCSVIHGFHFLRIASSVTSRCCTGYTLKSFLIEARNQDFVIWSVLSCCGAHQHSQALQKYP